MSDTEMSKLEDIANDSWYTRFPNAQMIEYCYEVFDRYLVPGSILELGPAEGIMTDLLAQRKQPMTLVDGAKSFCDDLQKRHPDATVIHALFEEFNPDQTYDNIVLGHVLEHVEDDTEILKLAKNWLSPGGRILAAVPNARSLHRQAAVIMGLLPFEGSMSEADVHHGHRRIYNPETLRQAFSSSGLRIQYFGGYWIKPVSDGQIRKDWTPEMLDAFMRLGERYPDVAAEVFVVAGHPE